MAFPDDQGSASLDLPVSPISPPEPKNPETSACFDKPFPEQKELELQNLPNPRHVPKRKPVPIAEPTSAVPAIPYATKQRTRIPPWLDWRQFSRRKRFVVGGIIAAVLLVVLIIGLAVGLTVGRRSHENLPLPTSHGGPYEGDLTYYTPSLGSCGITSSSSDMVCAVSHILYDAASTGPNPNDNPLCGLKLRLRRDGRSVDVKIVDRCVGCKETDIDVSLAVFKKLANPVQGRVLVHWSWLENSPVSVS